MRQIYYVGSRRSWWEKDYRTKGGKDKRNSYQRVSKWLTKMREKGDIPALRTSLEFGRRPSIPASWRTAEEYAEYTSTAFRIDLLGLPARLR